jgi:Inner membrane protein YgaP-like, transmembrane domain
MEFARLMATNVGRMMRILAGMILILAGLVVLAGIWRLILVGAGLLLIAAGIFNFCLVAPLIGAPFFGRDLDKS